MRCDQCGDTFEPNTILGVHRAREHGIKRWARQYLVGTVRPVCLRKFPNRTRLIEHIHDESRICRVNLKLSYVPCEPDEVEAADAEQTLREQTAKHKGDHRAYSDILMGQCYGPLQRFIIPVGHSRKNVSAVLRKALECPYMAREADFDRLSSLLGITPFAAPDSDADGDMPLDTLAATW